MCSVLSTQRQPLVSNGRISCGMYTTATTPHRACCNRASELAADRARDRALADAQRQKEHNRVRERSRSVSIRQSAGGVGGERERESRVRRWQLTGDVGKERERDSTAARRQSQSYRKEACRNLATIQKFQTLQGATNRSFFKQNPNRQRHFHTSTSQHAGARRIRHD